MKAKTWVAKGSKKNASKPFVCYLQYPDEASPKGYGQKQSSFATEREAYEASFAMQKRIDSGEFDER